MRRLSLDGRVRCEGVGRCGCLGRSSVMKIANWCRSGAHSLVWHRDSACLYYNGGEMRGGRGILWEEMKGDVWGKRGSDLHGGEDGKRTRRIAAQRMSKPKRKESTSRVSIPKSDDARPMNVR